MQILPQFRKGDPLSTLAIPVVNLNKAFKMKSFLLPLLMLFAFSSQANDANEKCDVVAGFHCPSNVYADCDDEIWDLSGYGTAYYVDYGGNYHYASNPTVSYHLNTCNTGYITRTWNYEDPYWNWHTCTQTIYVNGGGFNGNYIDWPEDAELSGCNVDLDPHYMPYGYGSPYYTYQECSMIGTNYKDDVFYFGGDCKKIRRTWTLIDWCNYDPNVWNSGGIWTHVQIIKITNDQAPDLYCPADIKVPSSDCDSSYVHVGPVSADYSVCGGHFQITNNSPYADSNGPDASGTYPIGLHEVTYSIKYGCFTNTTCKVKIKVEDSKRPVPYCYGQLTVALMPMDDNNDGIPEDGMVTIWASDLDKGSFHPCGYSQLHFSFSPDIHDTNKTFTCADVGKNEVRMYVTDYHGAQSYCIVEVDVQNNGANIPDCQPTINGGGGGNYTGVVSGRVLQPDYTPLVDTKITIESAEPEMEITENLIDVEYVQVEVGNYSTPLGNTVHIMGQDTIETYSYDTTMVSFNQSIMTDYQGQFVQTEVMTNEMVKMMPEKLTSDMTKVDVDDAKVLHAFITGTTSFTHPYLFLAADVDDNMKVNFDDLLHLVKYASGEIYALPTTEPFYFVQETDSASNPFDLPIINPVEMTLTENAIQNFYLLGIQKGDLDVIVPGAELQDILDNSTLEIGLVSDVHDLINQDDVTVTVGPNPSVDYTDISLNGKSLKGAYTIQVFDTSGKNISSQKGNANGKALNFRLDVSNLTSGYYFYNIQGNNKSYKGSFIRE